MLSPFKQVFHFGIDVFGVQIVTWLIATTKSVGSDIVVARGHRASANRD